MARPVDTSDGPTTPGSPEGIPPRWRVSRFEELDSTNRWALDRAREGVIEGLVVVADHQTAGRGRLDRTWEAPPGSSLLVSVLLHQAGRPDAAHAAVIAAAVALVRAVRSVAGVDAGMKWPNDVVVADKKLAGILAEAEGAALVVGLGVNVNWREFPPAIAETATACNLEAGHVVDREALFVAFLTELAAALDDPVATDQAHRDLLVTLGRRVRVSLTKGSAIEGEAVGLGVHGELEVRTDDDVVHTVTTGDVHHLRPA